MKKVFLVFLTLVAALSLFACSGEPQPRSEINGVGLEEYSIVYSESDTDYAKRAAEYLQAEILSRTGLELQLLTDGAETGAHEIVVGNTSRSISTQLDEKTDGVKFSILAKDGSVALEGNYFVVAAAAYYFIDTYVPTDDYSATVPEEARVLDPIVKQANNYIMLIGDGMGVYHTKMFEYYENTCEFGDGEDVFYGYMLPYIGYSKTNSLSGVTDSAAGGTALSTGYKTINGYVGIDKDGNELQSLTELFGSKGKKGAVMSTENQTGATPATFSAHANDRDSSSDIRDDQFALADLYGTVIDCGYNYYNKNGIKTTEKHIVDALAKVNCDEGFFFMYEEAYIDKHSHKNDMEKTYQAVIRFNQAIARFMEFAFYNPDTMVIITADHETGDLRPNDSGTLSFNYDDHTSADVLVFAYGMDAAQFHGKTLENVKIAHAIADLIGEHSFGDRSE